MNRSWVRIAGVLVIASIAAVAAGQTANGPSNGPPSAETRKKLMQSLGRGADYLKQQQAEDGIWEKHAGITGMAATALLRQPGTTPAAQMPLVGKSLDALAKLAKPDGGIYEKMIPHY